MGSIVSCSPLQDLHQIQLTLPQSHGAHFEMLCGVVYNLRDRRYSHLCQNPGGAARYQESIGVQFEVHLEIPCEAASNLDRRHHWDLRHLQEAPMPLLDIP